mgnify:CR=1 FL=1
MHLARRAWCRTYQTVFRIALPILPYTEPHILEHAEDVPTVLQKRSIQKVLIVTDPGIARLGLTASLERAVTAQGIGVTVYAETRANPTVSNVEEAGVPVSRERLPGHYRLWRRIGHGLCQGRGGTYRAAKQAHQQDAWPVARPPSPAAAYCGSHYRRYGKRSHARGGYHR